MGRLKERLDRIQDLKTPKAPNPVDVRADELKADLSEFKDYVVDAEATAEWRLREEVESLRSEVRNAVEALRDVVQASGADVVSNIPGQVDVRPLHEQILAVSAQVGKIPEADLSAVVARLDALSRAVNRLPTHIEQPSLEVPAYPEYDQRFDAIEAQMAAMREELDKPVEWDFEVKRANSAPGSAIQSVHAKKRHS